MPTTLIDGTTTPYTDSTAAAAALTAQAASGCFMEGSVLDMGDSRGVFSSSYSAGVLNVISTKSSTGFFLQDYILTRVYLTAAAGLSVVYDMALTHAGSVALLAMGLELYADDGTTLVDNTAAGPWDLTFNGTWTPTIPSDGYYYLRAFAQVIPDTVVAKTTSIELDISGGGSFVPCAVRAAYGMAPDHLVCT